MTEKCIRFPAKGKYFFFTERLHQIWRTISLSNGYLTMILRLQRTGRENGRRHSYNSRRRHHHHYMTLQFQALTAWIFLPLIFQSNANHFDPAVTNSFLASLVTASIKLYFGFNTGRIQHIFPSKTFLGIPDASILHMCSGHSSPQAFYMCCVVLLCACILNP